MYRGYSLELDESFFENYLLTDSVIRTFKNQKSRIRSSIKDYIISLDGGFDVLDADMIKNDWFPEAECQVFLSHSHKDEDLSLKLTHWLKTNFGLKTFIDSTVWGYADDLLQLIDNRYCLNDDGKTYSYQKRNLSTSHVHMMLNMAVLDMISHCECCVFLNTPNSIASSEIIPQNGSRYTYSPWIFSELAMFKHVERKDRKDHRKMTKLGEERGFKTDSGPSFLHKANDERLIKIDGETLELWKHVRQESRIHSRNIFHPLDTLYTIT